MRSRAFGAGRGLSATYHVLVVGNDLSGLMYAALAARAGYRVGVLGEGGRTNAYRHRGHVFLRAPERFYGFGTSPVVQRVFGDLAMGMAMRSRPRPVEPLLQLVLPDRRLDVPRSPERWRSELGREMSDHGESWLAFEAWAARWTAASDALLTSGEVLPPRGFRSAVRYRSLAAGVAALLDAAPPDGTSPLHRAVDGGVGRALVEGTLGHLVSLRTRPLPPIATVRLWTHLRAGVFRIRGGLDAMRELFLAKLKEQCGDHRPDAVVERVALGRRRAVEVVLAGRGERLGAELLVANMEPRRFLHLIPPDSRHDRFHQELAAREPCGWRLTVNVAVDPKVIPAGMGPEVVMVRDPRGALDGATCLWISRPGVAPFEEGEGRPGPGVLTVTAHVPARGIAPGPPLVESVVEGVLDALRELCPWLDDHLLAVDAPALVPDRETGRNEVDGAALSPVYGAPLEHTLGIGALPLETPYRDVLLLGDALFGGLGFEGACLGALQALAVTRSHVRLRVP